jgi:predicted Zn-ribbon and HTH transcriptional regulator
MRYSTLKPSPKHHQLQILDLWGLHHGHDDLVGVEEFVESRGIKFLMSPCAVNNCGYVECGSGLTTPC